MDKPLLSVRNLKTYFVQKDKTIRGVDGVSYDVHKGKTLAVVGESGSGKSVTSLSILQLLPSYAQIVEGSVIFKGEDLLKMNENQIMDIRGNKISMIFQEPMTSLNPVYTIGDQIIESLKIHMNMGKKEARMRAAELLGQVGIADPQARLKDYPFQLSGGMRQRVMVSIALACNPEILIADEPTSALDVTIQLQLMRLMQKLQKDHDMAIILITHDLGVVAEMADDIVVMYAGRSMEYGSAEDIFNRGKHPYLEGLKNCIPRLDIEQTDLPVIEGNVPDASNFPSGCKFHPRCPYAMERCSVEEPPMFSVSDKHQVRCWLQEEQKGSKA